MEDLGKMTPTIVIGKIVAFEKCHDKMDSSSNQSISFTCDKLTYSSLISQYIKFSRTEGILQNTYILVYINLDGQNHVFFLKKVKTKLANK